MTDAFIGTIILFAGNFAPEDWAICDGRKLEISKNPALFSIIETAYGGDGKITFALPDLRDRVPMGTHNPDDRGQVAGNDIAAITTENLPANINATLSNFQAEASGMVSGQATGNIFIPCGNSSDGASPVGMIPGSDPSLSIYANPGNATGMMAPVNASLNVNIISRFPVLMKSTPTVTINVGGNRPISVVQPSLRMNYIICLQGIYPSKP